MKKEKLSAGLAARLSQYLQVLMQAQKDGPATMSSTVMSGYTGINPTQIRRDLSLFGGIGRRGVGYEVDDITGRIREAIEAQDRHNIALLGAGNLGTAIAGSGIFNGNGFRIAAIFDTDPAKIGLRIGELAVQRFSEIGRTVPERNIVAGVLAVPASAAQTAARALIDAGVSVLLNYSEALIDAPPDVTVHFMSPVGDLLSTLYSSL